MAQGAYSVDFSPVAAVGQEMQQGARDMRQAAYQDVQVAGMKQQQALTAVQLEEAQKKKQYNEAYVPLPDEIAKDPVYIDHAKKILAGAGHSIKEVDGKPYITNEAKDYAIGVLKKDSDMQKMIADRELEKTTPEYNQALFDYQKVMKKENEKPGSTSPNDIAEAKKKVSDLESKRSQLLTQKDDIEKIKKTNDLQEWLYNNRNEIAKDPQLKMRLGQAEDLDQLEKIAHDYETEKAKAKGTGTPHTITKTSSDGKTEQTYQYNPDSKATDKYDIKIGEPHPVKSQIPNINAGGGKKDARLDKSYQYNSTHLEKIEKPLLDLSSRIGRLQTTIDQRTPAADALVAPEMLTVMAGGQGSGMRMNEAEISRIVGGRTNLESLKASLNKWQIDPSKGLSITPAQRQQMKALINEVDKKLARKRSIIDKANEDLIGADDVSQHRKIVAEAKKNLTAIDSGNYKEPAGALPGGLKSGW